MPTKQPKGEKKVKEGAWAIYHNNQLSDTIFETKKLAQEYIRGVAYRSDPLVMAEYLKTIKKNYKIIPIIITYQLPLSSKKTKK